MLTAYEKTKFRNLFLKKKINETMKQQRTKMTCIIYIALKNYPNCIDLIGTQCTDFTSFHDKFFLMNGNKLRYYFYPSFSSCNKRGGKRGYDSPDFPDTRKCLNLQSLFKGIGERIRTFG